MGGGKTKENTKSHFSSLLPQKQRATSVPNYTAANSRTARAIVLISPLMFSYWETTSQRLVCQVPKQELQVFYALIFFTGNISNRCIKCGSPEQGFDLKWLNAACTLHLVYLGGCSKPYYGSLLNTKQQFTFANVQLSSGNGEKPTGPLI